MMKKLLVILLAVMLLAGCGAQKDEQVPLEKTEENEKIE